LFNRYIPNSLTHIKNFLKKFRSKIVGTKYFPAVFVEDESSSERFQIHTNQIDRKSLKHLTENYNFPLLKLNQFSKLEISNILHQSINHIVKEKNDEFPYNIIFSEKYRLNCLLKYAKNIFYLNIFFFIFIIVCEY
jgi:hypothetical protein